MKHTSRIIFMVTIVLATLFVGCSKQDKVVSVRSDDPDMTAAIAKARDTLPQFWQIFEKHDHGETDFSLKIKITDKKGTEFFWLTGIERKEDKIFGTINNDADIVGSVKLGDRISI